MAECRVGAVQLHHCTRSGRQANVDAADFNNARIQKFDARGRFLSQWSTESPAGPTGLALDSAGHVYVLNHGHHEHYVQKFDADGNALGAFGSVGQAPGQFISGPYGLAVDGVDNVYASDLTGTVQKSDGLSGRVLARWPKTGATRLIALDDEGNILIRDETKERSVVKYRLSD